MAADTAYLKVSGTEKQKLFDLAMPHLPAGIVIGKTTLLKKRLPFYPGAQHLIFILSETVPVIERGIVHDFRDDAFYPLWTGAAAFQELNTTMPIELNEDNILSYIRFYFKSRFDPQNPIRLTETVEDIHWLEEPPVGAVKVLAAMLKPLTLLSEREPRKGFFMAEGHFVFRDGLYSATISVTTDGDIKMSDHCICVEKLELADAVLA